LRLRRGNATRKTGNMPVIRTPGKNLNIPLPGSCGKLVSGIYNKFHAGVATGQAQNFLLARDSNGHPECPSKPNPDRNRAAGPFLLVVASGASEIGVILDFERN